MKPPSTAPSGAAGQLWRLVLAVCRLDTRRGTRQSAERANAVSDSAGEPRRDLLDQPRIAVRIFEGEERPVARALGVGAAEPRLRGERRPVPHPTRVDATANEFVMSRLDVAHDQPTRGRARRGPSYSLTEGDRARGARRGELHDANALYWGDILVQPPTQAFVELLGSLDVGRGDDVQPRASYRPGS